MQRKILASNAIPMAALTKAVPLPRLMVGRMRRTTMVVQKKVFNREPPLIIIIVVTAEVPEGRTRPLHQSCPKMGMIPLLLGGSKHHDSHSSSDEEEGKTLLKNEKY